MVSFNNDMDAIPSVEELGDSSLNQEAIDNNVDINTTLNNTVTTNEQFSTY